MFNIEFENDLINIILKEFRSLNVNYWDPNEPKKILHINTKSSGNRKRQEKALNNYIKSTLNRNEERLKTLLWQHCNLKQKLLPLKSGK